jgi:hypothetical protein
MIRLVNVLHSLDEIKHNTILHWRGERIHDGKRGRRGDRIQPPGEEQTPKHSITSPYKLLSHFDTQ